VSNGKPAFEPSYLPTDGNYNAEAALTARPTFLMENQVVKT
jgi:hypothetical protein